MEAEGAMGGFYRACEWIFRAAYVNMLFILFTICGVVILGIFPAMIALYAVTRKRIMGETEISVFRTYWFYYKKEFVKSNLIGLFFLIIGYILYLDLTLIHQFTGITYELLRTGIYLLIFLYSITLMYVFPVYVHYQLKTFQYIKYACLLGASHPFRTLIVVLSFILNYFIMLKVPGLVPFFSVSVFSYIMMLNVYQIHQRLDLKRKEASNNQEQPL